MSKNPLSFAKLTFLILFVLIVGFLFIQNSHQKTPKPILTEDAVPKVYEPVVYTPSQWTASNRLPKPFLDSQELMVSLGVVAVRESGLDFDGQIADIYRYHSKSEPPLYVVDSDSFFELNWYFASSKDSDKDKAISLAYAKKAYLLSTQVLDKRMAQLIFEQILAQKTAKNSHIAYGECRYYRCQLVFIKKTLN